MPERNYTARALVLRKTKLGETDLIITLLAEDGSCLRAVAKGARKPRNSFSACLDLYSLVDVHCARGKNLDIVKEARRVDARAYGAWGLEQSLCAAPVAELVSAIAQEGLAIPRLFDMACAAFESIESADPADALALSAAALIKCFAYAGVRPCLSTCVSCGRDIDINRSDTVLFSLIDGGIVCETCQRPSDALAVDSQLVAWCAALLYATFDQIEKMECPASMSFACLDLCGRFAYVHLGTRLKSLAVLAESGLF